MSTSNPTLEHVREIETLLKPLVGQAVTEDLREQLAVEHPGWGGLTPHWSSLQATPEAVFLAVDNGEQPLMLQQTSFGSSVASFGPHDHQRIREHVERVDPACKPRPQGAQSAIATGNRHPLVSLPAAFDAFRQILRDTGVNLASTVQLSATREMTLPHVIATRDGENPVAAGHTRIDIRHLYHCGLWAAVRSGFREGYNAEADHFIITGANDDEIDASMELGKEAIRMAAGYTKFTTDTSRVFELRADPRHPQAWSEAETNAHFEALFMPDEQAWILNEFSRTFDTGSAAYAFEPPEIRRLSVKFGRSLLLNEELYDEIKGVKKGQPFDFEPSLDEAETLTTPKELIFYMHWLQVRERPAQLVPPNLGFKKRQAYPETMAALETYSSYKMWPEVVPSAGNRFAGHPLAELGSRVAELAAVARYFNGTLSIHSGSGKQAEVLGIIGEATERRFNYKISGELQLQMFDVLREQPQGSEWRALYERMVARCEEFAMKNAFGEESSLAAKYRAAGCGDSLGDAAQGRVDGNLFLVFWLGNLVGSRDTKSPDGDHRFFKEKLDELPAELIAETQRRNSAYVQWLAHHLMGTAKGGTRCNAAL